jgi:hypothetical protein
MSEKIYIIECYDCGFGWWLSEDPHADEYKTICPSCSSEDNWDVQEVFDPDIETKAKKAVEMLVTLKPEMKPCIECQYSYFDIENCCDCENEGGQLGYKYQDIQKVIKELEL